MPKPAHYIVGALLTVLALMALGLAWQHQQINALKLDRAEVQAKYDKEVAAREREARIYAERIGKLQTDHANQQQEKEDAFNQQKLELERARAADRARAVSLRNQLAAATSTSDRPRDHADPVACQRDADRLEALGRLAGEGLELLEEGRSLLNQREAELNRVLQQVLLDRQTLRAAATNPSPGDAP